MRLVLLLASLLLLSDLSPELRVFQGGGWEVWCASDSGAAPRTMDVSVRGGSVRRCSELKVRRRIPGQGWPQVFSVKGIGALRPALPPPGAFGATFYASGYWDCDLGLRQTLQIRSLDISLEAEHPEALRLAGRAENPPTLKAPDFVLRLEPPQGERLRAALEYTLVAARDVCVRSGKQARHEGFRIARAASNFISPDLHDSDAIRYRSRSGREVCVRLANREDFALPAPEALSEPVLELVHETPGPRPTPTLAIHFLEPPPEQVTPQGYVTGTFDPNADNIDVWGNWSGARGGWRAGERIGRFAYVLEAAAPAPAGCGAG